MNEKRLMMTEEEARKRAKELLQIPPADLITRYMFQEQEIERLSNIINRFENSLIESNKYINNPAFRELFKEQLEYLQELKGSDRE